MAEETSRTGTDVVYNTESLEGMKTLIRDESIDLIITDPPYDVNYGEKSTFIAEIDRGRQRQKQIERDKHFDDTFKEYEAYAKEFYRVLKKDTHCYLFCSDKQVSEWRTAMLKAGFKSPQILVWVKNRVSFDMTFGHRFPGNTEFILFFQKGWKRLNEFDVERSLFTSTLFFDSSTESEWHSCAKPIPLIMYLTKLSSDKGDLCLDPFAGGGAHLVSFVRLKRNYIGFEVSPVYYQTIVRRLGEEKTQQTIWSYA